MNDRLVEAAAKALLRKEGAAHPDLDFSLDLHRKTAKVCLDAILATLGENEYLNNKGEVVRAEKAVTVHDDGAMTWEPGVTYGLGNRLDEPLYRLIPTLEGSGEVCSTCRGTKQVPNDHPTTLCMLPCPECQPTEAAKWKPTVTNVRLIPTLEEGETK